MNIFLEYVIKHKALKKVYDVIFSCTSKYHLDGARRFINLYIKNYSIREIHADKLWKAFNSQQLKMKVTKAFKSKPAGSFDI